MDKIKSAVGVDKKDQEGQEPASGATGEGTTAEPFDGGNKPGAPESAGKSDAQETAPSTTADTSESKADSTSASPDSKEHKSGIGSKGWFKSANPFSKSKSSDQGQSDTQASAGAEQANKEERPPSRERPPNHLGVDVPSGTTDDLAPDPTTAPGASTMASPDPQVVNASADNTDQGSGWQGKLVLNDDQEKEQKFQPTKEMAEQAGSGPKMSQLRGSRASIAGPTADKSRREPIKSNPGRIPTAGGMSLGQKATEARAERRASRISQEYMPPIDKQGSPDATTEGNTVANTVPQSPGNGEGSSRMASVTEEDDKPKATDGAAETPTSPAAASSTEATSDTKRSGSESKSPVDKAKDAAGAVKERRGSRMEELKEKFKLGGSKK